MLNIIEQDGKKYVELTELYEKLELNLKNYKRFVKEQLFQNEYANEGVDYSSLGKSINKGAGRQRDNYLLTLNFAKDLIIRSQSKVGKKYRDWLINLDTQKENLDLLTHEEVLQLTMLVKCFSYLENCVYAEQMNMSKFVEQSKAKTKAYAEFHIQRNRILQLDTDTINKRLNEFCIEHQRSYAKNLTKREKLAIMDKYEILKAGVWDYLTFKGSEHALKLANLCKEMSKITNGEMYKENKTDLFRLQDNEATVLQLSK